MVNPQGLKDDETFSSLEVVAVLRQSQHVKLQLLRQAPQDAASKGPERAS